MWHCVSPIIDLSDFVFAEMASADPFTLDVSINPTGWGPAKDSVPNKFLGKPFQSFKLSDAMGTVADFTGKHHNRRW